MDPSSKPYQQSANTFSYTNSSSSDGMSTPPAFSRSNAANAPWSSSLGIPDGMRSPPTEGGYAYYNQQGGDPGAAGGGAGSRAFSDLKRFGSLFGVALTSRREENKSFR